MFDTRLTFASSISFACGRNSIWMNRPNWNRIESHRICFSHKCSLRLLPLLCSRMPRLAVCSCSLLLPSAHNWHAFKNKSLDNFPEIRLVADMSSANRMRVETSRLVLIKLIAFIIHTIMSTHAIQEVETHFISSVAVVVVTCLCVGWLCQFSVRWPVDSCWVERFFLIYSMR